MLKIVDIEKACNAIDFGQLDSFNLKLINNKSYSLDISLFDISGRYRRVVDPQGNVQWRLYDDTDKDYVIVESVMGYEYLINSTIKLEGFRFTSDNSNNYLKSIRILNRNTNGMQLIKPHSILMERSIFERSNFFDVTLNDMYIDRIHVLKMNIEPNSYANLLFKYSRVNYDGLCSPLTLPIKK